MRPLLASLRRRETLPSRIIRLLACLALIPLTICVYQNNKWNGSYVPVLLLGLGWFFFFAAAPLARLLARDRGAR